MAPGDRLFNYMQQSQLDRRQQRCFQLLKCYGADPNYLDYFWSVLRQNDDDQWHDIMANLAKFQPGWFK